MKYRSNKRRAVSLVETLTYVAVLAVVIFVGGKLLILVRVALLQKRIVISRPTKQPLAANLKDAVHELVNEFAVVGNHQNPETSTRSEAKSLGGRRFWRQTLGLR